MTTRTLTILGCGSSGGVPRIDGNWGACKPDNPRNRRRRAAALVRQVGEGGRTTVLIDTPPDLRDQMIDARAGRVDAVLYTHDHADHVHGIDDLRVLALNAKRRVPVYMDGPTMASLDARFGYCFNQQKGSAYPPILAAHRIEPFEEIMVEGRGGAMTVLPIPQVHGDIVSLGFRIGAIAYSPDVSDLGNRAAAALEGLDVWIVDSLRYIPHPSHFSVKEALSWIKRLRPKRAILTHLHIDLDYDALKAELPPHVEPAYDGMVIEF